MASLHAGKLGGVREYLQSSLICHPHDWLNALVMQPKTTFLWQSLALPDAQPARGPQSQLSRCYTTAVFSVTQLRTVWAPPPAW